MRTLQKGGMVQKEGIIKGRVDAGGHFKWEGWCRRHYDEDIAKGKDGAGGQYKREG